VVYVGDYIKNKVKSLAKGNLYVCQDEILSECQMILFERWKKQLENGTFGQPRIFGYLSQVVYGQFVKWVSLRDRDLSLEEMNEKKEKKNG
jgi:hypothetical protein